MTKHRNVTKHKTIIYIIFVSIYILCLIYATPIVAHLFSKSQNVYMDVKLPFSYKDEVYFSFDSITNYEELLENVAFRGWAFCETSQDNDAKEIWLILKSDERCYYVQASVNRREDVLYAYEDSKNILGINHGYACEFSSLSIKNGIYNLYIYCKENDENYGLVNTSIMLERTKNGIFKYSSEDIDKDTLVSSLSDISEITYGKDIMYVIDSAVITNEGYLKIVGWAFIKELESSNQSVYVRLTYHDGSAAVYDTKSTTRPDVGKAYGSNLYDNSGFTALIPIDETKEKDYRIEILVEDSNTYNVYMAEKTYSCENDSSISEPKERDVDEEKKVSESVNLDITNISSNDNLKYSIDSCSANDSLVIKGWSFITDIESSQTKLYLAITTADGSTRVYTTTKGSRPDVAKVFDNDLYNESGFAASIPIDAISEGENTITIIADNGQLLKAIKPYTFIYEVEDK